MMTMIIDLDTDTAAATATAAIDSRYMWAFTEKMLAGGKTENRMGGVQLRLRCSTDREKDIEIFLKYRRESKMLDRLNWNLETVENNLLIFLLSVTTKDVCDAHGKIPAGGKPVMGGGVQVRLSAWRSM